MLNYTQLLELLNGRDKKKLMYKTTLINRDNGVLAIKHHNTDILRFFSDNTVTINNGGHWSKTTKDRINKFGPVTINQVNGTWIVRDKTDTYEFINNSIYDINGNLLKQ